MNRNVIYWSLQIFGWLTYVVISYFLNQLNNKNNKGLFFTLGFVFVIGLAYSGLYRVWIKRNNWSSLNLVQLIPRSIASSIIIGILFHLSLITFLHYSGINRYSTDIQGNILPVISWITIFLIWSLIYFAFHFFENYRNEEIKNLRLLVVQNEAEINKIKSQLNPHFLFNSMNSIKALVTENPDKAKRSITKLSNILRNTLQLGEKKEILLEEELKLVKDYVDLEQNRYEERLKFSSRIDSESLHFKVPPMIVQTLVENAIKHGIANLPHGGSIELYTKNKDSGLYIEVKNTGNLSMNSGGTGLGIEHTKQRLNLLYGSDSEFQIYEKNNEVIASLTIRKDGNKNNDN
ncbi:MAG: histidine kinase [Flavobacteriales bacterium]|nr:histidine kinase [Flavobacteriales bacterium]